MPNPHEPRRNLSDPAMPPAMFRLAEVKKTPRSIPVPGVARDIQVKIASERSEWREAFQLVSSNYQARGYEEPFASKMRFTPYHALPDVVTLVAKLEGRVLATLSLVPDNTLLGLPLESIYGDEIKALRRSHRRVAELTSLAVDKELNLREFRHVFDTLIKLATQFHMNQGGDTWVITVNPRHRDFYTKSMGFIPLGPPRVYSSVQNHPAEGYWTDIARLKAVATEKYVNLFFEERIPGEAMVAPRMLSHLIRYLGDQTSPHSRKTIREVFNTDEFFASPRRW